MLAILPVELYLEIVEHLKPNDVNDPIIGFNGGWVKLTNIAKLPPATPGYEEEVEPWATAVNAGKDQVKKICALWNLRLTCKDMNQICVPLLFHTVNLVEKDPEASLSIPIKYAEHIRLLRVLADPFVPKKEELVDFGNDQNRLEEYQAEVVQLLQASQALTSLGLYFRSPEISIQGIADEVIQVMKRGSLRALGIYSILVLQRDIGEWAWNTLIERPAKELFIAFVENTDAGDSLKALDIATTTMEEGAYDTFRERFASLESFTIRRSLRDTFGRLWDPDQRVKWHPKLNLTRLNLIDCLAAYAPHIPELVRHFEALKFLMVSTCGSWEDVYPPPRKYGWHTEPDALCANRLLEVTHIEHMSQWEILSLGIIPTRRLILSNMHRGDFLGAIANDRELFPHLKTLSLVPVVQGTRSEEGGEDPYQERQEDMNTLRILGEWTKSRGAAIDYEGFVIKGDSAGLYGFA